MSFQVEEEQQKQEPEQPEVAKRPPRTVEEVLADVQGQYNFLQDSMLDFDSTFLFARRYFCTRKCCLMRLI